MYSPLVILAESRGWAQTALELMTKTLILPRPYEIFQGERRLIVGREVTDLWLKELVWRR